MILFIILLHGREHAQGGNAGGPGARTPHEVLFGADTELYIVWSYMMNGIDGDEFSKRVRTSTIWRCVRSGAVAGAVSAVVFALVHDLLISDIWNTVPLMMAAGVLCGMGIGWTYGLLFETPSVGSWIRYNMLYVGMFALLAAVSVLVFEPITTAAEVLASDEPPNELFGEALPLSMVFTVVIAGLIGYRYGRSWMHYAAVLLTCTVLVLLLGLNVAIIGLVEVPSSAAYLIVEMFGLIVALNIAFLAAYVALERQRFFRVAVSA